MLTHILLVEARHVTNPLFSQGGNASTSQWVGVDNPLMYTKERETKYWGEGGIQMQFTTVPFSWLS